MRDRYTRWNQVDRKILAEILYREEIKAIQKAKTKSGKSPRTRLYAVIAYRFLTRIVDPPVSLESPYKLVSHELDCSWETVNRHLTTKRRCVLDWAWAKKIMVKQLQQLGMNLRKVETYIPTLTIYNRDPVEDRFLISVALNTIETLRGVIPQGGES